MKVLHLGKYFFPVHGGLETILHSILCLTSGAVENRAFVANTNATYRIERDQGYEVHRLPCLGELLYTPLVPAMPYRLYRSLRDKVDILALHFPNPMAAISYMIVRPFRGREKLIVFYHSEVAFEGFLGKLAGSVYYRFERMFLSRADRIVVSNAPMRDRSPQIPRYREKTVIIHYAIEKDWADLSPEQVRDTDRLRREWGDRIVLFVGRLVPYKGLDVLLAAAGSVRGTILLVGDGPLRGSLRERIEREGLRGKVILAGEVTDTKPYFAACDLLVLPSLSRLETFGIVQIEAMAFGKPSVTSDLPTGVTYINVHGETGLTVPVGDAQSLAQAINCLLDDQPLRIRLGEAARAKVFEQFSPEKVRDDLLALYRDVTIEETTP